MACDWTAKCRPGGASWSRYRAFAKDPVPARSRGHSTHPWLLVIILENEASPDLRLDGDELAFRHDYVFSFFVAYWLSRNIHKEPAQADVRRLCARLNHEISANVLVFLAHLTDNPTVLTEMLAAASNLFAGDSPAVMAGDIEPLNKLHGVGGAFALPSTAPGVHRRLIQEAEDERAIIHARNPHDGRAVVCAPSERPSVGDGSDGAVIDPRVEMHRESEDIRVALRTINILGQVLRNKVQSAEGPEKVKLMGEVLGLGRRLLGHLYKFLDHLPGMILHVKKRLFRALGSV